MSVTSLEQKIIQNGAGFPFVGLCRVQNRIKIRKIERGIGKQSLCQHLSWPSSYEGTVRALFHVFLAHLFVSTEVHSNFLRSYDQYQSLQKKMTFSVSWANVWQVQYQEFGKLDESCPVAKISCGIPVPMGRCVVSPWKRARTVSLELMSDFELSASDIAMGR